MRKTFVTIAALALVQAVEARFNALDADNARLKRELADVGGRNEQLTIDRAELERPLMMKSGERGKSIADLRQRFTALEGDDARLTQKLAEAQKAREEKVREVSSNLSALLLAQDGEGAESPSARRHARLDHPSGGSQATVPMSAGTEISRSSRSLDAAVSLCRRPPGM